MNEEKWERRKPDFAMIEIKSLTIEMQLSFARVP